MDPATEFEQRARVFDDHGALRSCGFGLRSIAERTTCHAIVGGHDGAYVMSLSIALADQQAITPIKEPSRWLPVRRLY